jgi:hypothetical protein
MMHKTAIKNEDKNKNLQGVFDVVVDVDQLLLHTLVERRLRLFKLDQVINLLILNVAKKHVRDYKEHIRMLF